MTPGQRVTFEYHGNLYIFTVNQANVERQEKSNSIERGMISADTYIVFEASNSSGIKVKFYMSISDLHLSCKCHVVQNRPTYHLAFYTVLNADCQPT